MVLSQPSLLQKLSVHPNSFYYSVLWNRLYRRDLIIRHSIRCDASLPWGEDFAFNTQYMLMSIPLLCSQFPSTNITVPPVA